MTTRYVDLNCSNAIKRNETNNRYTYKLNPVVPTTIPYWKRLYVFVTIPSGKPASVSPLLATNPLPYLLLP